MSYNATAYKRRKDGTVFSVEAVEVNDDGQVIRACGFWSHLNGTVEFEPAWESAQFSEVDSIHIDRDGAEGYRNGIRNLAGLTNSSRKEQHG